MGVITRNTQVLFERAEVQLINKDLLINKMLNYCYKTKSLVSKKSCEL